MAIAKSGAGQMYQTGKANFFLTCHPASGQKSLQRLQKKLCRHHKHLFFQHPWKYSKPALGSWDGVELK
jgi:hypothetical protein